ncbi:hypothetical protein NW762_014348 [Fusarium torreyae]|uniref:Aminoglycoside phosphotransferase domain-containing protein n=1 Tax=Fusarium torreyae TaxID=1237075 RepID=A0A9W8V6V4_9HYPO|nr:hypothetical protein NW762_014348 [Fusarium torreyae]
MTAGVSPDVIRQKVSTWLNTTPYATASLEPLVGGQSNFTYLGNLLRPLQDGTTKVVVKHGEPYMARHPANAVTLSRCDVEAECLAELAGSEARLGQAGSTPYTVTTTKLYSYDTTTNTLVLEYIPNTIDLKSLSLNHFTSPTPEFLRRPAHDLGKALAEYIVRFHTMTRKTVQDWAAHRNIERHTNLDAVLNHSDDMQKLKHYINFDWLIDRIDQFPDILTEAKDTFLEIKHRALQELSNPSPDLTIIHGDFCPQNILQEDTPLEPGAAKTMYVVDWENAQLGVPSLDHGEMLGEMYVLWLCNRVDAGLWMFQGYAEGLGPQSEASVWRNAIQLGVHLLSFGTLASGWDTPGKVEDMARLARDIIVKAWNKDRAWFEQSDLACLFTGIPEK